ncbi:uncharacterized protein TNCV_4382221 [Trichonephila clavipes]|nr:uncharacterized protein TNCV_4382221 [Trichonephila clavipes]
MAYLGKGRREDLFVLATELNLKFDKSMTIATLKDLIISSEDYDKELTKNIHSTIVEDRKEREENLRIEEREEKLRFEQLSLYLKLFERQAQRLNIDQENWVSHLLGLLPTEVSHIIAREPDDKDNSYEHVKDLLLKRFKLTPEKFRQLFVTHQKAPKEHGLIFTMS